MKALSYRLFKALRITLPYTDNDGTVQYFFNLLNPLGIIVVIITGLCLGATHTFKFIRFIVMDSIYAERFLASQRRAKAVKPTPEPQKTANPA